jgi:hypothetical protein
MQAAPALPKSWYLDIAERIGLSTFGSDLAGHRVL